MAVVTGADTPGSLGLMADLNDADLEWILSSGIGQQVIANTILVVEGQVSEVLYLVLDGLLEVRVQSFGEEVVARVGPGEIVGEMSFLEDKPASATVRACENSLLLVLRRSDLAAKTAGDASFAARLCRSFARVLSQRLRAAQGALGRRRSARAALDHTVSERCKQISIHLDAMKRMLAEADRQAIRNDDQVPEEVVVRIRQQFRAFCDSLNEELGDPSGQPPGCRSPGAGPRSMLPRRATGAGRAQSSRAARRGDPEDLAYSIGLIDYFNDNFVVKLLDFVHDHLRPGGRVILGNFHPRNPGKAFMDHVLDWRLIHRDEADMNRLFQRSRFERPCEAIRYEGEGINLFAIGRR